MSDSSYDRHDLEQATKIGEVTATLKEHSAQLEAIFKDVHQIKNDLTKIGSVTMLIEAYKTSSETLNNLVLKVSTHESQMQTQGSTINALMAGVRKLEVQEWKRAGFYLAINSAFVIAQLLLYWLKK